MRNVLETFEYQGRERSIVNWPQGGVGHGGISRGSKFECTDFEEKGQNFSAAHFETDKSTFILQRASSLHPFHS